MERASHNCSDDGVARRSERFPASSCEDLVRDAHLVWSPWSFDCGCLSRQLSVGITLPAAWVPLLLVSVEIVRFRPRIAISSSFSFIPLLADLLDVPSAALLDLLSSRIVVCQVALHCQS